MPTDGTLVLSRRQDWRLEFTGTASAAGVTFSVKGWMEQDGLVNLDVTYAPQSRPVAIDDLRVEWPVDDSRGSWMSCIGGVGGNYSPRTIGKVPDGRGEVWNTLDGIGKAGSTMLLGNWESNLWVGNDARGLLWSADSDQGWVPNDTTAAHSLARRPGRRDSQPPDPPDQGEKPFLLHAPRTVQLQYNATPFRQLAKGWRLTQVSAANGFSGPDYKSNEKTKQDYFSILSMPSTDVNEWPEYYAKYQERAAAASKPGWCSIRPRLTKFLTNQIALRGYMPKTLEPGIYSYFAGDWESSHGETLNKSYRDYMVYLMDRQVREGGCTHFYFDISFSCDATGPLAGYGYRLSDGRVQPTSMDGTLREWYKRRGR